MILLLFLILTINHALAASTSLAKRSQQDYIIGRELSRGMNAVVYRAERKFDGLSVAMKKAKKKSLKNANEVQVMKAIKSPYVVRFIESFHNSIVMEYLPGGSLKSIYKAAWKKNVHFPDHLVKRIVKDIAMALRDIHDAGFCHRDVKIPNILIALDLSAAPLSVHTEPLFKLADFGFAQKLGGKSGSIAGSLDHFAPEMADMVLKVRSDEIDGRALDVWALGICMYQLVEFRNPFWENWESRPLSNKKKLEKILNGNLTSTPNRFERDPAGWHLINRMLNKNPHGRISVAGILAHPWITGEDFDVWFKNLETSAVKVLARKMRLKHGKKVFDLWNLEGEGTANMEQGSANANIQATLLPPPPRYQQSSLPDSSPDSRRQPDQQNTKDGRRHILYSHRDAQSEIIDTMDAAPPVGEKLVESGSELMQSLETVDGPLLKKPRRGKHAMKDVSW